MTERLASGFHRKIDVLRIHLNGEPREVSATTILALVHELGLDVRKVAVERNLEIVPRSLHEETALSEGDRVEVVQFVGGG
jgi:thiamine biosynthesis protein ThiS